MMFRKGSFFFQGIFHEKQSLTRESISLPNIEYAAFGVQADFHCGSRWIVQILQGTNFKVSDKIFFNELGKWTYYTMEVL